MAFDFKFPDVGEGIQEGEVVKWLVKEGDNVKENQNIVQVETDKSVIDLPSPKAGTVLTIAAKNGDTVKVGGVLCTIGTSGEKISASQSSPKQQTPQKTLAKQAAKKEPEKIQKKKSVAVVGQLEEAPEENKENEVEYKTHASTMRGETQSKKVLASPAVRKLAVEHNINLSKLRGSGDNGIILKKDLAVSSSIPQQTIQVSKETTAYGNVEKIPLKGIRKTISVNMTASNQIPHVTAMEDADITRLWVIKEKEKKKYKETNLTLLPFITKAVIAVLKENPYFNSSLNPETNEILLKKYYNIGIAVETPVGLMVPVVKSADRKTIAQIADEIHSLAQKARDRTIAIDEMKGSTFTITNYGSIGGTYATPLINPGESSILGVGRAFYRLNPDNPDKKILVLPLSLTFDHRIVDGAQAARFIESLKLYLEDPSHLFVES